MSFITASVEYGLHCLTWLVQPRDRPVSSRDLAEMQGVSVALLAKIMPRLEKAGIVAATGGIAGGYKLARAPGAISVLDVVEAIDGTRPLFDCQEVRRRCVLFDGTPPAWSRSGVCGIHAVMLRAEKSMRAELARTTLHDLVAGVKFPAAFGETAGQWFTDRAEGRERARIAAVRGARRNPAPPG